jgi:hypothetical protein
MAYENDNRIGGNPVVDHCLILHVDVNTTNQSPVTVLKVSSSQATNKNTAANTTLPVLRYRNLRT